MDPTTYYSLSWTCTKESGNCLQCVFMPDGRCLVRDSANPEKYFEIHPDGRVFARDIMQPWACEELTPDESAEHREANIPQGADSVGDAVAIQKMAELLAKILRQLHTAADRALTMFETCLELGAFLLRDRTGVATV